MINEHHEDRRDRQNREGSRRRRGGAGAGQILVRHNATESWLPGPEWTEDLQEVGGEGEAGGEAKADNPSKGGIVGKATRSWVIPDLYGEHCK